MKPDAKMAAAGCVQIQRDLATAFVQEKEPPHREHVENCPDCRQVYHRLFSLESHLGAGAGASAAGGSAASPLLLGPTEQAVLLGRVLGSISTRPRPRWRRWREWLSGKTVWGVGATATVTATAALLLLLLRPGPDGRDREFAARGGALLPPTGAARLTLHPLCLVSGPESEIRSLPERPLTGEAPRCTVRDRLGFGYENHHPAAVYLAVVVRRQGGTWKVVRSGTAKVLAPTPARAMPVPLEGAVRELGDLGPGLVEVMGLWSFSPIALEPQPRSLPKAQASQRLLLEIGK